MEVLGSSPDDLLGAAHKGLPADVSGHEVDKLVRHSDPAERGMHQQLRGLLERKAEQVFRRQACIREVQAVLTACAGHSQWQAARFEAVKSSSQARVGVDDALVDLWRPIQKVSGSGDARKHLLSSLTKRRDVGVAQLPQQETLQSRQHRQFSRRLGSCLWRV